MPTQPSKHLPQEGAFKQPCGCRKRGAEVRGMHVLPHKFFRALEPGVIFCNLCLDGHSRSWCEAKVENGMYSWQATHFTVIPWTR